MKLAKALKCKNRLIQEIKILQSRVSQYNSHVENNKPPYDTKQAIMELHALTDRLVLLKAKIATANVPIVPAILEVAEIKGMISILQNLDTKEGEVVEPIRFSDQIFKQTWVACISRVDADQLIKEYTERLDILQEQIDEHNAVTTIED